MKKNSFRGAWDITMCVMGVPEGKWAEKLLGEMPKNPKVDQNKTWNQENQQILKVEWATPRHVRIKMLKDRKILKTATRV